MSSEPHYFLPTRDPVHAYNGSIFNMADNGLASFYASVVAHRQEEAAPHIAAVATPVATAVPALLQEEAAPPIATVATATTVPQMADVQAKSTCVICLSAASCIATAPCGHMCMCVDCYNMLPIYAATKKCPICTADIKSCLHLFFS